MANGFGGFNFGKSGSSSTSFGISGLSLPFKGPTSRLSFDFLKGSVFPQARSFLDSPLPEFPELTAGGFLPQQRAGATAFANQLFGKASASLANRGFLSPQNQSAVVGSALTQAAPSLLPLIGQNVRDSLTFRENVLGNRFGAVNDLLQSLAAIIGDFRFGQGSSSSVNFGARGGSGDPSTVF